MTGTRTAIPTRRPHQAAAPDPATVTVLDGRVPDQLDDATGAGLLGAAAPGRYLLRLPTVGAFLVERTAAGTRVTVERADRAHDADVACLLAGPVRYAGWLLAGRFALRGCGVVVDGRAVAITGESATGKSAVTAALAQRGHRLLADGALPVRLPDDVGHGSADGRRPTAEPADTTVHLWPDMVERLGLDACDGETVRPGLAKRRYRFSAAPAAPLAAIVVVRWHTGGDLAAVRASGFYAVDTVAGCTAMRPLVGPAGEAARHFGWCTRLAAAVPVLDLRVDHHSHDLSAMADAVEALVRRGPQRG